jgi:hypothetical protein
MSRTLPGSLMALGLLFFSSVVSAELLTLQLSIRNDDRSDATRVLRAKQGDRVVIEWSTDKPVAVHIHPYEIAQDLVPGTLSRTEFMATISGRFPIEAHSASRGGRRIVAYLEVLPR